eukprot:CAMPEP_0179061318 /NCGR_PEP_ID=MMETSP0796-20121207/26332_1 /TAXON_ID=73915 /ORGANISM="Pyrodinium bahamense, Strain pbaha01" /LENGTH=65 /DNA_ID=CAMNT_0020758153 /DNA_START=16 /DNA_END=209 /DNA_ORIENTATION=-
MATPKASLLVAAQFLRQDEDLLRVLLPAVPPHASVPLATRILHARVLVGPRDERLRLPRAAGHVR